MNKTNSPIIIVLLMALVSFMCLSLSVSYSYVFGARSSQNTQVIQTGNLNADIAYTPLSLELTPMTDDQGLKQDKYSTISISKDNQYSIFYNISLGYNLDSTVGRSLDELLPLEYIKVALFKVSSGTVSSTPVVGPISIGDLPLSESNENILLDAYSLMTGTFSIGSDTSKYALKAWLDNEVSDDYNGRVIYLGIKVKQEPLISKNIYNIAGKVTLDGAVVNGATLSFHNGQQNINISSGNYELLEIIEGTYNLSVTLSTGRVYETNITISPGSSVSVSPITSSVGSSGSYIQSYAYLGKTTPLKIIKYNNLKTDSNEVATVNYNIPPSYLITGNELIGVQSISGINIALTSSGAISVVKG